MHRVAGEEPMLRVHLHPQEDAVAELRTSDQLLPQRDPRAEMEVVPVQRLLFSTSWVLVAAV